MNTPNPLVPQGTLAENRKSRIRITFFAVLAIHVVFLGLLLIAGCNKKQGDQAQDTGIPPVPPAPESWPPPPTSPPPAVATAPLAPSDAVPTAGTPAPGGSIAPTGLVPSPTEMAPAGGGIEHTISKGDSFYSIGKKYGVGYKAIVDANPNLNPNRLKIGDKVKVPAAKTAATAPTTTATAAGGSADGAKTYKVKSGDNLMKIAKTYNVSVKQLRAANSLKTDQIKVGQVLKIPAKTAPAVEAALPSSAVPPVSPPPAVPGPQGQ